jgi:hypothetical protein
MGGYIDVDGNYKSFTDKQDMINYIQEHTDKDTLTYATNNMFDYQALFSEQYDYYQYSPLLRGGRIIMSKYRGIKMLDTMNYVAVKLEVLGELMGLRKGNLDVTHNKSLSETTPKEYKKLRDYNKRDCQITRDFMIQFQNVVNMLGSQLRITIGSCAMDLFQRKYLKQNIYKEYCKEFIDGETVKDFIFRGYHGGRTEMFKRGNSIYKTEKEIIQHHKKDKYYIYDFNNMYGSCMREEYPLPSSAKIMENQFGKLPTDYIFMYHGMSECEVVSPYMYYPILPTYIKGKLLFPIGRFRDVFTHHELRKFVENGGKILKVFKMVYYTKTFSPFKDYVNDLHNLRNKYKKDNNMVYSAVVKNLLVNLYGKFGTHKLSKFEMFDIHDGTKSAEGVVYDEELGLAYQETPIECNQSYVHPILASTTTMYGRLKLYDKLIKSQAIYCDTDSCFTQIKMSSSDRLGEMKLEKETSEINLIKPKMYKLFDDEKREYKYKAKGMQLSKKDRGGDFENLIDGKTIQQWKFSKMKESLRTGRKANEKVTFTKKASAIDNKRIWLLPYNKFDFQDSRPIIMGFKDLDSLNNFLAV